MSLPSPESTVLVLKQQGKGIGSVTCRKRGYVERIVRYEL